MVRRRPSRLSAASLVAALALTMTWDVAHTASSLPDVAPAPKSSRFT
jgi:hypothetical protein